MQLPLEQQNIRPLRHIAQLLVWKGGLGILDIDTQKKKKKLLKNYMDSKMIKSYQCSLEKSQTVPIELNT